MVKEETLVAKKTHTKTLVISGMLTAILFIVTRIAYPIPGTSAYVNMGDSVIYCTGLLIGAPWAVAVSAIGSALADWAIGYPIYIPATILIKGLMGLVCAVLMRNDKLPRFVFTSILSGAIMAIGYFVYEVLFIGGWGYASVTITGNLIQWAAGVIGAAALYYPVKRIKGAIS